MGHTDGKIFYTPHYTVPIFEASDKILWLGIKNSPWYVEFYAKFEKWRNKKVLRRSAIHYISPGIELTTFGLVLSKNPEVEGSIPGLI